MGNIPFCDTVQYSIYVLRFGLCSNTEITPLGKALFSILVSVLVVAKQVLIYTCEQSIANSGSEKPIIKSDGIAGIRS